MSLPENLVVDANPILSALIGGKAQRLFQSSSGVHFHTTAWTVSEVEKYLPQLASKASVDESILRISLDLLMLEMYASSAYQGCLEDARHRIDDPKDVDLLALALTLGFPVWSNDNDFQTDRAGVAVYRTAELLSLLDALERPP